MSGNMEKSYQLLTLNAKKIVNDMFKVKTEEFSCNLMERDVGRQIIQHTDNFGSNALFYQILQVLPEGRILEGEKSLREFIVFLDFSLMVPDHFGTRKGACYADTMP